MVRTYELVGLGFGDVGRLGFGVEIWVVLKIRPLLRTSSCVAPFYQGPQGTTLWRPTHLGCNIGALIIRIGFWGIVYDSHTKNPHNRLGNY